MTRDELRAELRAHGFDFHTDARLDFWVANAAREVTTDSLWPFRLVTVSGAAPLTIANLGKIENVLVDANTDAARVLFPKDRENLVDEFGNLARIGTPEHYWVDAGATVRLHPVATTSIEVRHFSNQVWTTSTTLTAASSTDTPRIPEAYHELVVLLARCRALEDNDLVTESVALQTVVDRRAEGMRHDLLGTNVDEGRVIRHVGEWA